MALYTSFSHNCCCAMTRSRLAFGQKPTLYGVGARGEAEVGLLPSFRNSVKRMNIKKHIDCLFALLRNLLESSKQKLKRTQKRDDLMELRKPLSLDAERIHIFLEKLVSEGHCSPDTLSQTLDLTKEFRARDYPLIHLLLQNPLQEFISTGAPGPTEGNNTKTPYSINPQTHITHLLRRQLIRIKREPYRAIFICLMAPSPSTLVGRTISNGASPRK